MNTMRASRRPITMGMSTTSAQAMYAQYQQQYPAHYYQDGALQLPPLRLLGAGEGEAAPAAAPAPAEGDEATAEQQAAAAQALIAIAYDALAGTAASHAGPVPRGPRVYGPGAGRGRGTNGRGRRARGRGAAAPNRPRRRLSQIVLFASWIPSPRAHVSFYNRREAAFVDLRATAASLA